MQLTVIVRRETESSDLGLFLVSVIMGIIIGSLTAVFSSGLARPTRLTKSQSEHQPIEHLVANTYESASVADKLYDEVRVLCWIIISPNNQTLKMHHVNETWGKRCNKRRFFSDSRNLKQHGNETNINQWSMLTEDLKNVYRNHMNNTEWLLIVNDDTYVILENLRYMLYPYPPEAPIYFPCQDIQQPVLEQVNWTDGCKYIMSIKALQHLVEEALYNSNLCGDYNVAGKHFNLDSCLKNAHVGAADTKDSQGLSRIFSIEHLYNLLPRLIQYPYPNKTQLDCCSKHAVSIHNVSLWQMRTIEQSIYHFRTYGIVRTDEPLPKRMSIEKAISASVNSTKP